MHGSRTLPVLATALILGLSGPSAALAQTFTAPGEDPTLVDRVVAIVGDSVILMTDIKDQMFIMDQGGIEFPTEPDELRQAMRDVLESLIDLQLVLQEAAKDSTLIPSDDEIDARVDQAIETIQARFPSPAAFQQALVDDGQTQAEYRALIRSQILNEQIQQLFLQRRLAEIPPVAVTDAEMRVLYDAQRDQLQQRPELLSIEQILLRVTAADSAWESARVRADSVIAELQAGADFAELADQISPDAAGAGGDLGWFRRGSMVREFEDVAFRLPDGQVSAPVRTDFGWHLIRVDRARPGEVKARHILIRPTTTAEDGERALALGQLLADSIRGGADAAEVNEIHGEADQSWSFTVSREQLVQELPAGYAEALATAQEGDVVGPFQTQLDRDIFFVVIRLSDIREAGEFSYEDLRDTILERLQEQKKLDRLRERLREAAYVEIRF